MKSVFTREKSVEPTPPPNFPVEFWQRGMQPPTSTSCSTVHACVDAYAQTLAALGIEHWRYNKDGGRTPVSDSEAMRVLRRPNSYQTRSDLTLNLIKGLLLTGNGYLLAVRDPGSNSIRDIHLSPPKSTTPYIDPEEKAIFYRAGHSPILPNDLEVLIPARHVAHFKLHTPYHPLKGASPVENAALSIALNATISAHQLAFHQNMGRPSGILTTDKTFTEDQRKQMRLAWNAVCSGSESGGTAILGGGMTWQAISLSAEDSQIIETFKMSVEDIARAFRVPLPLVGAYEHATFNNVEQLIGLWLSTGLGFLLEHIEQVLDRFFDLPDNEHIELDTDSLKRTDFGGRIDALAKAVQGGIYSPNEARAKEGLRRVDNGDEPRLQAQVVPLSQAEVEPLSASPSVPVESEDESTEKALSEIRRAMEAA